MISHSKETLAEWFQDHPFSAFQWLLYSLCFALVVMGGLDMPAGGLFGSDGLARSLPPTLVVVAMLCLLGAAMVGGLWARASRAPGGRREKPDASRRVRRALDPGMSACAHGTAS